MPYVELDSFRLHYKEYGSDTDKPPLLFIHGFTVDHRMWLGDAEFFSQWYRCLLLDLRGHGLSDSTESGYSRAHRVEDIIGFLDSLIIALGRTRDLRALKPILAKVKLLDASRAFSHHRAVALALEVLGDPAAAKPLSELLAKPGMSGHAMTSMEEARRWSGRGRTDTSSRNVSLRELVLARALWRCGDHEGLGEKILRQYERDLRGHYARHAHAVLEGGIKEQKR